MYATVRTSEPIIQAAALSGKQRRLDYRLTKRSTRQTALPDSGRSRHFDVASVVLNQSGCLQFRRFRDALAAHSQHVRG